MSYAVKTSANGVATFNLAKLTKGNFVATVKFAGNKYYNAKDCESKNCCEVGAKIASTLIFFFSYTFAYLIALFFIILFVYFQN